jgi:hypothetical protein
MTRVFSAVERETGLLRPGDVIEDANAQEFASLLEPLGDLAVFGTRRGISRGVVVEHDECDGSQRTAV